MWHPAGFISEQHLPGVSKCFGSSVGRWPPALMGSIPAPLDPCHCPRLAGGEHCWLLPRSCEELGVLCLVFCFSFLFKINKQLLHLQPPSVPNPCLICLQPPRPLPRSAACLQTCFWLCKNSLLLFLLCWIPSSGGSWLPCGRGSERSCIMTFLTL